jgi:UDP-N-acetylglucosamine/UDP-N-acetylgalactosamine diphosphorylase
LGSPHPKGMFDPGVPGVKSIFELIVRKLQTLGSFADKTHPGIGNSECKDKILLIVMTSPTNYEAITTFFKQNNHFGYKSVIFFSQPHLPLALPKVGVDGGETSFRLLLNQEGKLIYAPNGNGGLFQ